MGLDTGFLLKNKQTGATIEINYFRKYFELRDWIVRNCQGIDATEYSEHFEFLVTYENFKELEKLIERYAIPYSQLNADEIELLEEEDIVPARFEQIAVFQNFGGNEFNPRSSRSVFPIRKLLRLYHFVNTVIDAMLDNLWDDYDIIFYQSY